MAQMNTTDEKVENIGVPVTAGAEIEKTGTESPTDAVAALRRVAVFADLPIDQLRWFAARAEEKVLQPGEILFPQGTSADWMIVYLAGETHSRINDALDGYVYIARAGDPATEVSGKLPFSRMTEFPAAAHAVVETRLLMLHVRHFPELIQTMPHLVERLIWQMTDRVREFTTVNQQRDKLMALGKLSAGLAHELNNPAAAARRSADELLDILGELRDADLRLCRHDLSREQRDFLTEFEHEAIATSAERSAHKNSLAQSDAENDLIDWLDAKQVEDGWRVAPALVEGNLTEAKLEKLYDEIGAEAFSDVLERLAAQLSTAKLAHEIKTSATRISELVGAIKEYSYMDKAAVQKVDVARSLENTLLILKYKLKKKNIEVVRELAGDLPKITAWGSELNQVWTNLVDNAIDALPDSGGQIKVRAVREPDDILVEIRDNGAGIPPELQTRIFEPFFTTKAVGEGTGLGLDTVARVVRQHQGNLRVESKAGDTCFQIRLPLENENAPRADEVKNDG